MKTTFHSYQDQGSLLRDYTIVSMCLEANSLEMISKYHTDHLLCQISKSLKKSNMANYSKSKQSKIFVLELLFRIVLCSLPELLKSYLIGIEA